MFDVFIFVFVLLYLVVKTSLDAGVGDGPPQLPTSPDKKKCAFSTNLYFEVLFKKDKKSKVQKDK